MKAVDIVTLCLQGEMLKNLTRTGWALAGVQNCYGESVASHAWGTAHISLLLVEYLKNNGKEVNLARVLSMAIVHDLPEALMSDIPKTALQLGGESMKKGKHNAEREALDIMMKPLGITGTKIQSIWEEFNTSDSVEAQIVKASDVFDMLVHALAMERNGVSPKMLHPFFISSQDTIDSVGVPVLDDVYKVLLKEHEANALRMGINLDS
ncbi:MAG: HD family hydrolase [Candidatus Thorarchaeota archaeon]|nr:HD family hydrolase [Candidatus Thorarchaeota archaeon]